MSHHPVHPGQDLGQDEAIFFGNRYISSKGKKQPSQLLACLDDDSNRDRVASHAVALALALDLPIAFAHVVEGERDGDAPTCSPAQAIRSSVAGFMSMQGHCSFLPHITAIVGKTEKDWEPRRKRS